MYFVQRYIDVTFIGPTTVKLTRHRVSARIRVGGAPGFGEAQVAIYGMSQDLENKLATFGRAIHPTYDYKLIVEAGDEVNGMNQVFQGTIAQAWGDFQAMPNVPFWTVAQAGLVETVQRTGTQDWNGYDTASADVAQMMEHLAGTMGLKFENNGVNVKLDHPYHYGSPLRQAHGIADAAHIEMVIDNGVLAIWPMNKSRGDSGLYFSRDTGMVTYPTFTEYGVLVKTEFRKPIKYGSEITIKSDLTPANQTWSVRLQDYDLQSLVPGGNWYLSLGCVDPKYGGGVLPG